MTRKILVAVSAMVALFASGCANLRPPEAAIASKGENRAAIPSTPPTKPTPQTTRAPAKAVPRPTATPALATARAGANNEGKVFLVARNSTAAPVPLFRQAIVLANVRAAVAGLPAPPKAEFQRGLLTLTFPSGTQNEIDTAISRTLAVPEVTRLRVIPPP